MTDCLLVEYNKVMAAPAFIEDLSDSGKARLQELAIAAAPSFLVDLKQADEDLIAGRSRPLDDLIAELDAE